MFFKRYVHFLGNLFTFLGHRHPGPFYILFLFSELNIISWHIIFSEGMYRKLSEYE